jgi:hypothetical protein
MLEKPSLPPRLPLLQFVAIAEQRRLGRLKVT